MKAAVCHAFGEPLVVEDLEIDAPRAGQVAVRLAACAICHSDIAFMEGAWGGGLPAVYGHEAAGVVEGVGPGVAGVAPGDHVVVTLVRSCGQCPYCRRGEQVLCDENFPSGDPGPLRGGAGERIVQGLRTGAFAQSVVVAASQVVPIPADVPFASACLLACGVITGFGAVTNTAKVAAGSSVVVIGTGGVGLNSVQAAAIAGARPVIAMDLSDAKLAAAERFGASHAVNPGREDARGAVRALTAGQGADHVFVTVGVKTAIEQGLGLLRRGGQLIVVGMPPSGVTTAYDPLTLANDELRILGSKMGSSRPREDVPRLVELYKAGRLKLDELVTGRYPLERINEAVAATKGGQALRSVVTF